MNPWENVIESVEVNGTESEHAAPQTYHDHHDKVVVLDVNRLIGNEKITTENSSKIALAPNDVLSGTDSDSIPGLDTQDSKPFMFGVENVSDTAQAPLHFAAAQDSFLSGNVEDPNAGTYI